MNNEYRLSQSSNSQLFASPQKILQVLGLLAADYTGKFNFIIKNDDAALALHYVTKQTHPQGINNNSLLETVANAAPTWLQLLKDDNSPAAHLHLGGLDTLLDAVMTQNNNEDATMTQNSSEVAALA